MVNGLRVDFERKILNEIDRMEAMSTESLTEMMERTKEQTLLEVSN